MVSLNLDIWEFMLPPDLFRRPELVRGFDENRI
jgi:hypothetical protein